MAKSSKIGTQIALASTTEERNRRLLSLRQIAADAGFSGRDGGNLSALLTAIADLPLEDRNAIGLLLKKYLQGVDKVN